MLISKEDLQKFTNVYPEDDFDLQDWFISSACDTVKNYLGYDPEIKDYDLYLDGNNKQIIYLPNIHINSVDKLSIDGTETNDFML